MGLEARSGLSGHKVAPRGVLVALAVRRGSLKRKNSGAVMESEFPVAISELSFDPERTAPQTPRQARGLLVGWRASLGWLS